MTNRETLSPRPRARTAGVLYLITIVCGVFAEVFVRGALVVRADAAATARNILQHEMLYRSGFVADLVMLACYVAVTLLFCELFAPVNKTLSSLAMLFSMVGIAVLAMNALHHFDPLIYLRGTPPSGLQTGHLQELALLSLRMHSRGYGISSVFFGIYCILIGALAFRSRFLPRSLGVLMAAGGAGFLISSFLTFLFPSVAARFPDMGLLGGLGELALTSWLIVRGVNVQAWDERNRTLKGEPD